MENEFPKRKPTRLKSFDYSTNGVYFITICTQDRKNILSRITAKQTDPATVVGEGSPLPQGLPLPQECTVLTCYGKIVDRLIREIPCKYQNVSVDNYVIMPNHIHILLSLFKTVGSSGRGDPNGRRNASPTETDSSTSVSAMVGWLKYQATKEINSIRNTPGEKVFQRSFYDHVVRNRDDYNEIYKYICDNPIRWQYDKLYSDEHNY